MPSRRSTCAWGRAPASPGLPAFHTCTVLWSIVVPQGAPGQPWQTPALTGAGPPRARRPPSFFARSRRPRWRVRSPRAFFAHSLTLCDAAGPRARHKLCTGVRGSGGLGTVPQRHRKQCWRPPLGTAARRNTEWGWHIPQGSPWRLCDSVQCRCALEAALVLLLGRWTCYWAARPSPPVVKTGRGLSPGLFWPCLPRSPKGRRAFCGLYSHRRCEHDNRSVLDVLSWTRHPRTTRPCRPLSPVSQSPRSTLKYDAICSQSRHVIRSTVSCIEMLVY